MFGLGRGVDPQQFVIIVLCFVVSITVHEFAHAWTANRLGDDTARLLGRITLNPVAHFDPIGFLFLLLIALGGNLLGWGKPVPVNAYRLVGGKRGMALVAAAGPLSNLIIALALGLPIQFLPGVFASLPPLARAFIETLVLLNIALAAFNLIPLPPLDGLKILTGLLPDFWTPVLAPLDRYGFIILFLLFFSGSLLPGLGLTGVITGISGPVFGLLRFLILGPTRGGLAMIGVPPFPL